MWNWNFYAVLMVEVQNDAATLANSFAVSYKHTFYHTSQQCTRRYLPKRCKDVFTQKHERDSFLHKHQTLDTKKLKYLLSDEYITNHVIFK